MATTAIALNVAAMGLLDIADVLTWCARKLNEWTWVLVGKCKEAK